MPFTPLHMGPGIAIKALMRGSFSLMVFGWTQILMDIQPLVVILTGKGHLHGFTHTWIGATLIGTAAALTGKPAGEFGLRLIRRLHSLPISWKVALASAFIGSYSHVLFDSVMHSDLMPIAPFASNNPFLRVVSVETLHLFCLAAGIVGILLYAALTPKKSKDGNEW